MKSTPMTRSTAGLKRMPMAAGTVGLKRTPMAAGTVGFKRTPMAAGIVGLKRVPMAASSAPMVRSAIKTGSVQLVRSSTMAWKQIAPTEGRALSTLSRQRRLRSRGPKMTPIRRSAKGEDCTLNIPGLCTNKTDTTVWCHSNLYADGKGMGQKANDEAGCYGCATCHAFYDGGWTSYPGMTRELVEQYFAIARAKSRLKLKHKGLVE